MFINNCVVVYNIYMSQKFHIYFFFFQSSFLSIYLFIYSDFNLLLHVHHEYYSTNTMFLREREYINLLLYLFCVL